MYNFVNRKYLLLDLCDPKSNFVNIILSVSEICTYLVLLMLRKIIAWISTKSGWEPSIFAIYFSKRSKLKRGSIAAIRFRLVVLLRTNFVVDMTWFDNQWSVKIMLMNSCFKNYTIMNSTFYPIVGLSVIKNFKDDRMVYFIWPINM